MTPTAAAIRTALGPSYRMKSDREIAHIVVSVLGACREPSERMMGAAEALNWYPVGSSTPTVSADPDETFPAMIDALIEEVTAEGGR